MSRAPKTKRPALQTLWASNPATLDPAMMNYTVAGDRIWDRRLLRWDVLGSLGHIEGLRAAQLLNDAEYRRLRRGLRDALIAVTAGKLAIGAEHEDAHSAVEMWLTARCGVAGEKLHTGRSRNDQIACDLRLYLKDALLARAGEAIALVQALLRFASRHRTVLWPGYTHTRRAMPSSAGLWAAAFAEGVLDTVELLPALWGRIDRSPLGSAAGYGVPLPLDRERTARALGFAGIDQVAGSVQNGRGKLEALVLGWCVDLAHDLSRFAADVILFSADEYGVLLLPEALATGSSIMPQKRNPDLFELTRARCAALEGDLVATLQIKGKLTSGYHRDFQLLKEPLFRGLDRAAEMLGILTGVPDRLAVDRKRCRERLAADVLATDEVMRRVETGTPFRRAYHEVAALVKRGEPFTRPADRAILDRRTSTGGLGNLGLGALGRRARVAATWQRRQARRFGRAMEALAGRGRR